MPIITRFAQNGRILVYEISDPWSLDEINQATVDAIPIFEKFVLEHPHWKIHGLVDATHARHIPQGILRSRTGFKTVNSPNAGYTVIFGASLAIQVIAETLFRLARYSQVRLFRTEAEAKALIAQLIASEDAADPKNQPQSHESP